MAFPTYTSLILVPQDQEIIEFYVVQERRATDFVAPILWKGSSGWRSASTLFEAKQCE